MAQFYGIRVLIPVLILLGLAGAAVNYFLPDTVDEPKN